MNKPNFFIVGAAKSGTTTLYDYLKGHPEVFMPKDDLHKEPSHFSNLITWYKKPEKYFPLFNDAKPQQRWIGEASTAYLSDPSAAANIHKYNPNARIIIILRNPADRAYSMYCWMVQEGYEYVSSFERALSIEERRTLRKIPNFWEPQYYYNYLYFRAGLYYEQVKRYFDLFPGNVLVMTFEELLAGAKNDYAAVREFLKIGPHGASPDVSNPSVRVVHPMVQFWLRKANNKFFDNAPTKEERDALLQRGIRSGKPPALRTETRLAMLEKYRDNILLTAKLINKDLDHWLPQKDGRE